MRRSSILLLAVLVLALLGRPGEPARAQAPAGSLPESALVDALSRGDTAEGLKLAIRMVEERQVTAGDGSPQLMPALRWRGYFKALGGDVAGAAADFTQSFALGEKFLGANAHRLTDAALAAILTYLETDRDLMLSLLADRPDDQKLALAALGMSRAEKGRLMELMRANIQRTRLNAKGPYKLQESRQLVADMAEARAEYERILFAAAQPFDAATIAQLQALEQRITAGQQAMNDLFGFMAFLADVNEVRYKPELLADAGRPPIGSWTIDYATFRRYRFGKPGAKPAAVAPAWEYLGFLSRSDGRVAVAALGPAAEIDPFVLRLLNAAANPLSDYLPLARQGYNHLVAPLLARSREVAFADPGAAQLDRSIINRFVRIFPDGNLNLVAFAALNDGTSFLVDQYDIGYAASALQLGMFAPMALKPGFDVDVYADPDFRLSAPAGGAQESNLSLLNRRPIRPLPGTLAEASAIGSVIPRASIVSGAQATRRLLLEKPAPGVLHVATHGIFFDDTEPAAGGVGGEMPGSAPALWLAPMVETGLVLAGSPDDSMGGIVTALDVLGLDLSPTQLVVLSACETARGAVRPGDSVYGLRYAFHAAGAETVVASLWKVPDDATKSLMARYYANLLGGNRRLGAMTEAMRQTKKTLAHPAFWAAFTVSGAGGLLRGSKDGALPEIRMRR
ncbi:MAG: CHAT domain-containing protein [Reyranella sp.]|uniref:CHAT domain-containing protein n=1 Tax=Reyranella sp. TaxID=1929291 RepID=UPI001AC0F721|nr:CHAT domain-containing protein [Reyranella sp.]MBN9085555.1 CHAT domain-containing protein [Reyranella sp.]